MNFIRRNLDTSEEEEAHNRNNKKTRNSFNNKESNVGSFPLVDISSWNAFHQTTYQPVHHWWIQQYSILHPFFPAVQNSPHEQTHIEEALLHCLLPESTFI